MAGKERTLPLSFVKGSTKESKSLISRNPNPINVRNAVVRRPQGYGSTTWPITAQFRMLQPQHSKLFFRLGWGMRWGAVAAMAAYFYVPYAEWYVRNGWNLVTGQEYEPIINTDRSRFFNYSY
uniref:Uncharacterized protein n=1 Tax=Percolomonas cosmopolitus TaxID=63605 RepID=A0A7S1KN71_9EUKA|eukprot:CAMPEP_0117447624 /NCGR_PEP_ID=MMETSP0759-20121206/6974_1 /TAXON_ID=63605 /ORGANISM="Percolomonas cosmopolitus, Strain WS" /LENGTH=122 /DNA_ID=CAMNT_0005239971 /DNA_START=17 /DNA_END=385 /DNA_ORIENTATION=+